MASGLSNYAKNLILNKMFNGAAITWPTSYYIQLYTATPTSAGGGTQVTGGGFGRVEAPMDATNFPTISTGEAVNAVALTFAQATAAWGTIVAWGAFDALSAGNLWWFGPVTPNKVVGTGDVLSIAIGVLRFKFSNAA